MTLALAITALIFGLSSFFLGLYNTVKLIDMSASSKRTPPAYEYAPPQFAPMTANTEELELPEGPSFDFGYGEDNV